MSFLHSLPTHRRIAAALAFAGVLSVVGAVAVHALEGEPFRVAQGEPGGGTYGPILTSDPSLAALGTEFITPDDCRALPSCMLVPFEIEVPPGLGENDDFTVHISVGWESEANDIDVAVWDDGAQAREEAEAEGEEAPEDPPDTLQTDAATSGNPEVAKLYKPEYVDYQLVVINFSGPPVSVDVVAEMFVNEFTAPFELLAPEPTPAPQEPERAAITPSTSTTTTAPPSSPTTAPTLSEIEVEADEDFQRFVETDFEEQLEPQVSEQDLAELASMAEELETQRASEPSGAALVLGLVVAPVLFVSAAGAWMWRRSPSTIRID